MRLTLPLLLLVLLPAVALAQTILWGTNDYIEYQVGTLPVVIPVPHGGDLAPAAIPDHTCYAPGNTTNGLQMELNFAGVRDNATSRALFAEAFATVITDYLSIHTGVAWGGCAPVSTDNPPPTPEPNPGLYPNPVAAGGTLQWSGSAATGDAFTITDILGHTLVRGSIDALAPWPIGNTLPVGTYIVTIVPQGTHRTFRTTLVVQ